MRNLLPSVLCGALLLGLTSCGDSKTTQGGKAGKKTIAVIPKGLTHEFWKAIHAGAEKAAQEAGVQIEWQGPVREDSREDQVKIVEQFITQSVDGIVLAPLDDQALVSVVEEAGRKKIPVVIIDSGLKSQNYVSFVATDNKDGGRKGGEYLAKLIGNKGKVAMLRYAVGSASTMAREEGFLEAMKKFPDIEVVSSDQYGGATTETAFKASENLLASLKKEGKLAIGGIFCPNESSTFGMLRALTDGGLAGHVRFVGFDASDKLIEGLKNDHLQGLILQNPMRMGYLGVKTMVDHLNGTQVEKRVDTGSVLVTKENMDEAEIKDLLHPPLDKYLK
ncbi:MAG: substrate-binding domain-containing protein [Planctomycetota bacterium]|nr:substrate-binding domain-containing protein [Planctomycetota bacterium]